MTHLEIFMEATKVASDEYDRLVRKHGSSARATAQQHAYLAGAKILTMRLGEKPAPEPPPTPREEIPDDAPVFVPASKPADLSRIERLKAIAARHP